VVYAAVGLAMRIGAERAWWFFREPQATLAVDDHSVAVLTLVDYDL